MSRVRVLDEEDVRRLLPMADCIAAMEDALRSLARGEVYNPLRPVFRPPNEPSLMGLMPAHRGGEAPWWSLKALTIVPGNSSRGLDSHQGFVALFDAFLDTRDGTLLCGDLFTHLGDGPALTHGDLVGPAIAAEEMFQSSSLNPDLGTVNDFRHTNTLTRIHSAAVQVALLPFRPVFRNSGS